MKVIWQEVELQSISCGHGVEFHAGDKPGRDSLFAFLEGYKWLHEAPEKVVIMIRKPGRVFSEDFLKEARNTIEKALLSGKLRHGMLDSKILAWLNA